MGNFKVRVNSEAESREVQDLAIAAGYKMDDLFCQKWDDDFCYLLLCEDMSAGFGNEIMADGDKPLSIGELRAMVKPSLNDQYAEIEQERQAIKVPDGNDSDHAADAMAYAFMGVGRDKISQTLNERQSQYGSFKGVADTTALFMDQFTLGRMSNVQREALHMICSKLARIANGDPNHVDSWHDIAGYATLVVDDLES